MLNTPGEAETLAKPKAELAKESADAKYYSGYCPHPRAPGALALSLDRAGRGIWKKRAEESATCAQRPEGAIQD